MDGPIASLAPHAPAQEIVPVLVHRPAVQTVPVVFASPHSGREYAPEFICEVTLDPLSLRRSEDSFVDELFGAAPEAGAPLVSATFPRVFCDANREPWELDPAMFVDPLPPWVNTTSPRISAGLGTIARIVSSGETIYRDKLLFNEAERRIRDFWQPFHITLEAIISGTRAMFGGCLLIDCHSMPSTGVVPRNGRRAADFVLGDAHGTTCSARVTRIVERMLIDLGYIVRRNDPYAGGFITRHYGRPRDNVHALQIEVARELYMDEERIERLPRFASLQQDISRLITGIAREAAALLQG